MKESMKGIIKKEPREGGQYREDLPMPVIKNNEVLVNVRATAICGTDQHIYRWTAYAQERLKLPMVFGHEFAGDIVQVGKNVLGYAVGDRVAGETHIPCNECYQCRTGNQHICENMKIIGVHVPGSFAEYLAVPKDCLWKLDDSIDYKIGSLLEPMGVAVHGILSGEVGGLNVLVLGCGPIGLMAVGTAYATGASKVFAVDLIDEKLEAAKKMGADVVINSKTEDINKIIRMATNGRGADVVVDYTGNASAIREGFKALKLGGRFTLVGLANGDIPIDINNAIVYKEARVNGTTGRLMYKTWYQCMELLARSDKFNIEPIIGGVYPMAKFDDAFQALAEGAVGKMILIP